MSTIVSREGAKFWFGIELPKHVISMARDSVYDEWKYYTTYDVLKKKRDNNKAALERKRAHKVIKPAYVWVFYNDGFIFSGWWIYIKTLKNEYALNFRTNWRNKDIYGSIIKKIMNLYPCDLLIFNFDQWAAAFEKKYHHEAFKRKKQGLLKCYAIIDKYGDIIDIKP